jgi:predicted RNA-binding Zn-ribbon protein involved in translation (DUF1610 family)
MPIGIYEPDATEGITRVEDLPKPIIVQHVENHASRPCPRCGRASSRRRTQSRTLHDLGDVAAGRPVELHVTYSQHRCKPCGLYFNADMSGLAMPGGHYTNRVVAAAVAAVAEDGLPYQSASWRLWRDQRVFVPAATVQNWVEEAGEKKPGQGRRRVPRRRAGRLQRVRRRR